MSKVLTREVRKYIYAVAIAFVPLAIYLGWIEPEAAAIVLPLILAVLNLTPKDVDDAPAVDGSGV